MTLKKKSFHLFISKIFLAVTNIIMVILASRVLSIEEYGVFRQSFLIYEVTSPFLMLGLDYAIFYFLPRFENKRKLVLEILLLFALTTTLFGLALLAGGEWVGVLFNNVELKKTVYFIIPYTFVVLPITTLSAVLVSENKTYILLLYNIITSIILLSLFTIAIYTFNNSTSIIIVRVLSRVLFFPFLIIIVLKIIKGKNELASFKELKTILKYSIPVGLASMVGTISMKLDQVVVSAFTNPIQYSIYVNGAMEIPFINIITSSISSIILAEMTKLVYENETKKALSLFRLAAIKSAVVLYPIMIYLLIFAKDFIITLYSNKYAESAIPFTLYLFLLPIRVVIFGAALSALGKTRIMLNRSIIELIINTVLCLVFVQYIGYNGAALATIITTYAWSVSYNLYEIKKGFNAKYNMIFPLKELFAILIISVISCPIIAYIAYYTDYSAFIKLSIGVLLYFPIPLYFFNRRGYLKIKTIFA